MKYKVLKYYTSKEAVDEITDIAVDLGIGGIEIVDKDDALNPITDGLGEIFDLDVSGYPEGVLVKMYIPDVSDHKDTISKIKAAIKKLKYNLGANKYEEEEIDNEDWSEGWKEHYEPIHINNVVIVPEWTPYTVKNNEKQVLIDPGMAFGTGDHSTTKLCIERLIEEITTESTVLDIGCGSGILSLVASILGAKKVYGYELSEVAIEKAKKNVEINNLSNVVVEKSNLAENIDVKGNLIIANLIDTLIIDLLDDIEKISEENNTFICSGIIEYQIPPIIEKIKMKKYNNIVKFEQNGWYCIVAKK